MAKKESSWTIYCHSHVDSGRRYIGLTKLTMMKRWNRHVYDALRRKRGKSHFANAIRKYGKNAFSHEVLEVCDLLEEANAAEIRWIEHFDTRNHENGFNLTKGGDHAPNPKQKNPWNDPDYLWHDPEYRKAHGRKMKTVAADPIIAAKRQSALLAFIRSPGGDKWKEKLRQANLGRSLTAEHREAVAKSISQTLRVVSGHVSCGRHGLVPFDECVKASSRTGRVLYRCKRCHLERCRTKIRELIAKGICVACRKSVADAGTRCRLCADRRNKRNKAKRRRKDY